MQPSSTPLRLVHPGTGRQAFLSRGSSLLQHLPIGLNGEKYVLFIASKRASVFLNPELARQWIDAGASYVCAWGPSSDDVEESFDYASFLPELGEHLPFTLMTTSHKTEELDEALWFAFYNASPPDDLDAKLQSVVILVDSPELEEQCKSWVGSNRE